MKNLLKPRTIIAFMLYGTFCYLAIKGKVPEQAVIAVVSAMMGFYYGGKKKRLDNELPKWKLSNKRRQ